MASFKFEGGAGVLLANTLVHHEPTLGNLRCTFGECIGSVEEGEPRSAEETVSELLRSDDFRRCLASTVGSVAVAQIDQQGFSVALSYGSAGMWFVMEPGTLRIWDSESQAVEDVGSASLRLLPGDIDRMVNSHQLLARRPFSSFAQSLHRLPPGFILRADLLRQTFSFAPLQSKANEFLDNPAADVDRLGNSLSAILKLYRGHFDRLGLLFSGGLDSSVLLAAAVKTEVEFDDIEFFMNTIDYPFVDAVAHTVGKSVSRVRATERPKMSTNPLSLIRACRIGMGALVAETQLYFDWIEPQSSGRLMSAGAQVSGQNADTLYLLDTFAPGSQVIGLRRGLLLLDSSRKRLLLSRLVLGQSSDSIFRKLLVNVLCFPRKPKYFSNWELARNLFLGADEHVQPFRESLSAPLGEAEEDEFSLACSVLGVDRRTIEQLGYDDLLFLLKNLRWLRTVQNSHTYFRNRSLLRGNRLLHPFSEGPMVQVLMGLRLDLREVINPKRIEALFFRLATGKRYRRLVYKSVRRFKGSLRWWESESEAALQGRDVIVETLKFLESKFPVHEYTSHSSTVQRFMETRAWEAKGLPRHSLARALNWRAFELQVIYGFEPSAPKMLKDGSSDGR